MNGFPLTIRKQPSGETFWIHVEPTYQISTCKQKIQRMRGISACNIRLAVANSRVSEINQDDEEKEENYCDEEFQQRTLDSLGLSGGSILEMNPITLYVRSPTGRLIKFKDAVDVEASVDRLMELVAAKLESLHLLKKSVSSKDRFRLFHDRILMRRGTPITKYKVKNLDILRLKFGTDESDASQREKRKEALSKSEAHQQNQVRRKSMRRSESEERTRPSKPLRRSESEERIRTTKQSNKNSKARALSSSPLRWLNRKNMVASDDISSPRKRLTSGRTRSESESVKVSRKNNLLKSSSQQDLQSLSKSKSNIRSTSASPMRGPRACEVEPFLRRKMKANQVNRGMSDTSKSSSSNRRPKKQTDEEIPERRKRFSLKKRTDEDTAAGSKRSRSSHTEKRGNNARNKSSNGSEKNVGQDQNADARRRRNIKNNAPKPAEQQRRRRSRSASKSNPEVEPAVRMMRSHSNSEKNRKKNPPVVRKEGIEERGRSHSNKSSARVKSTPKRRNSGSGGKSNPAARRTRDRSHSLDAAMKRVEEGHPRKLCSQSPSNPKKQLQSKKESKKRAIPHAIAINFNRDDGNDRSAITPKTFEKKGPPPASPTSVVAESLTVSIQRDDYSEGSSDIQSHETEFSIFPKEDPKEEEINKLVPESKETPPNLPSKTENESFSKTEYSTSNVKEDPVVSPSVQKLRTNSRDRKGKTSKNNSKPNHVSLRELKVVKANENKQNGSRTADNGTSSDYKDTNLTSVGRYQTILPVFREGNKQTEKSIEESIKNTPKARKLSKRDLKVRRPEETSTRACKTNEDSVWISKEDSFSSASLSTCMKDVSAGTPERDRMKSQEMKRNKSPGTEKALLSSTKKKLDEKLSEVVVTGGKKTSEDVFEKFAEATPIANGSKGDVPENSFFNMVTQTESRSFVRLAKAAFEKGSSSPQPLRADKKQQDKKRPFSMREVATTVKPHIAKDSLSIETTSPHEPQKPIENSVIRLAKAKFERRDTAAQSTRPGKQHSFSSLSTTYTTQPVKDSSKVVSLTSLAPQQQKENRSVVEQAKAKFENRNSVAKSNEPTRRHMDDKRPAAVQKVSTDTHSAEVIGGEITEQVLAAETVTQKRRLRRINSIGPSEPVIEELKETLGIEEDKAMMLATTKPEKRVAKSSVQSTSNGAFQTRKEKTIRPLRPSLKDTPSIRAQTGTTFANAAAEATAYLEGSTVNIARSDAPKVVESGSDVVAENEVTTETSVKPQNKSFQTNATESKSLQSPATNIPASAMSSVKDRIQNFSSGKDNANIMSAEEDSTIPKPDETDSINARSSIKNRIQKFQTKENANATSIQIIGIQTLGLAAWKDKPKADFANKDDCSASTTYSFFCSNDESSEYEDGNSKSGDSTSMGEYESIYVIGPDLTPIEIPIYSDSERLGSIKKFVAEASGIPVEELRLAVQSEESDIEGSHRIALDDDYKLTPGDILAVQPVTVVVKLPDGGSKLELSTFPGTVVSDIKEYIAENTGTDPSRQSLYDFEKNFNDEMGDETPITTDCILRLTSY